MICFFVFELTSRVNFFAQWSNGLSSSIQFELFLSNSVLKVQRFNIVLKLLHIRSKNTHGFIHVVLISFILCERNHSIMFCGKKQNWLQLFFCPLTCSITLRTHSHGEEKIKNVLESSQFAFFSSCLFGKPRTEKKKERRKKKNDGYILHIQRVCVGCITLFVLVYIFDGG
jgi:hypothetical protein